MRPPGADSHFNLGNSKQALLNTFLLNSYGEHVIMLACMLNFELLPSVPNFIIPCITLR